jgi:RNA polymerase sigma-70 factor (ECF subfamily)
MEVAIAETGLKTITISDLSPKLKADYDLVQSAILGNQHAYAELLNRYRNSVYHTVLKMVKNRDDADDLTIEAFGKAFNKLPTYTPSYAFSTWLFRIAINNCIDFIRKKRIHFCSIDEQIEINGNYDYASNIRSSTRNPEDEMVRDQRIVMMKNTVTELSQKYRVMIELRYYEEKSYEEIATQLDIPLGTVKAQLHRAKELLYGMLKKPGRSAYLESTRRRK